MFSHFFTDVFITLALPPQTWSPYAHFVGPPLDQFSASGAAGCFSSCIYGRRGMQTLSWPVELSARRKVLQGRWEACKDLGLAGDGGESVNEASSQEVVVLVGIHTPW